MKQLNKLSIRHAELNDIEGILAVFEQNLLSNKKSDSSNNFQEQGFLAFGLSFEDIKREILDYKSTIALVAEVNNKIIGFTLGNDFKMKCPSWQTSMSIVDSAIKTLIKNRIFYHDYIARSPGEGGVGKKLFASLMKKAAEYNYPYILCEIAEKPYMNKASISFHERFGFKRIGTINKNELVLGIYLLKIK